MNNFGYLRVNYVFNKQLIATHFEPGMGGCPGIWRDPGLGPANPRDWDRDRDSKPRDSRYRDKNLRDSPGSKIPRDNKSRHLGKIITVSPGTVPLSRDSDTKIDIS